MAKKKKQAKKDRKDARKDARQAKKTVRKKTRTKKKAARQEKRSTKKAARKEAKATKKSARKDAKAIKDDAKGGTKSQKKTARKKARTTRKEGRQDARGTKKTARKQAKKTAKKKIGTAKDDKKEAIGDIRAEKREAIRATRKGWENWLHDLKTDARRVDPPKNAAQLRKIIQAAVDKGLRVKPVASCHSHSNATQPSKGHWYVDISELTGVIDLKDEKPTWGMHADRNVVRVKAGTRIQKLTSQILAPLNLGVANMGSFDGQTVSGVVNTDTHGTGVTLGGFGDMVVSADIFVVVPDENLKPEVELWRVEKSDGQTNPARASSVRGVDRLVQDDDLFHAMVVGFGSFGVAYSYLLQVTPFFWLDEVREVTTIKGLRNEWANARGRSLPAFLTENRHAWAFVNAAWAQVDNAKFKKGDPRNFDEIQVRLLKQNPVKARAIPRDFKHKVHPLWPPMRHRDDACEAVAKFFGGPQHFKSGKEAKRYIANKIDKGFIEDSQAPFFHTGNQSAYYRVLRRTRDNKLSRARTPGCKWDNSRIDAPPKPPTLALSLDMSVPVKDMPRALNRVLMEYHAETIKLLVPIGIRFADASDHFMAASFGRQSAFMELAGTVENKDKRDCDLARYKRVFSVIGKAIREEVAAARPHLGKHHSLNHASLLEHYPKAKKWLTIQGYLNYSGTWTSPFTTALGAAQYKKNARQTRQWLNRRLG